MVAGLAALVLLAVRRRFRQLTRKSAGRLMPFASSGRSKSIRRRTAPEPACHFGLSSTVDVPAHQQLGADRLLPVTPEVASSSLVDPAIYSLQVNNFQ